MPEVPRHAPAGQPQEIASEARRLAGNAPAAFAELRAENLLAAWNATTHAFRDPGSPERRELDPLLRETSRLSPAGLDAAMDCVLRGVRPEVAQALVEAGEPRTSASRASGGGLAADSRLDVILLASNLPGLAVQPLLRSLAARRSVLLKSPRAEPHFVPAFLAALTVHEPRLSAVMGAAVWHGGDRAIEQPVFEHAGRVVAYGDASTIADLRSRVTGKLVIHGPKTSVAWVTEGCEDIAAAARGVARDVALFDQRGCLSVAAVYVDAAPHAAAAFARELARELEVAASSLPPGRPSISEAAGARQARDEAVLRGLEVHPLDPLAAGTVIVERDLTFRPTPGLRTVRVHPVAGLDAFASALEPWRGQIQGVAVSAGGKSPEELPRRLAGLGVSRVAAIGSLQEADATWDDGEITSS